MNYISAANGENDQANTAPGQWLLDRFMHAGKDSIVRGETD